MGEEKQPAGTDAPIIQVDAVVKTVGTLTILRNVSFTVRRSELTCLIGPSGSGKSTILRCLNGLETFDSGSVRIAGVTLEGAAHMDPRKRAAEVCEVRKRTGMVFQQFNLFPHLTVLQNITLAPRVVKGVDPSLAEAKAAMLLVKVGLGEKALSYPSQLSGGQQQRVAIARALAMEPDVLLYDEPTSALDPALVDEVLNVMKSLKEEGMTQVVVTHEMRFARDVSSQGLFLYGGTILESGPSGQLFKDPQMPETREFLKRFLSV